MKQSHWELRPAAEALVRGGPSHPNLAGTVSFTQTPRGVLVMADFAGLPTDGDPCAKGFFALHVHEGGGCGGEAFADSGGHWNPGGCPHPAHAGDLPPLLNCGGKAFLAVLTDRFTADAAIGRTVILHSGPDDFTTQPSGSSGEKMACGVIRRLV